MHLDEPWSQFDASTILRKNLSLSLSLHFTASPLRSQNTTKISNSTGKPLLRLTCQLSDHKMTSNPGLPAPLIHSITHCLSEICSIPDENYSWENPRRFSGYAKRLQLVLNHFLRSSPENLAPSVQTALKGISGDLTRSGETLLVYRKRSKIYVLINCKFLCASLQERTIAIGGWLALLDSALDGNHDLHKKTSDLSREMKQAQFRVTENEERVYCTLQREAEVRQTSKAVQSAIIMDLARALGADPENHAELEEQIKLLKNDIATSNSVAERRILTSLERTFNNWSVEPYSAARGYDLDFEEEAQLQPFKNFLCPLTKEVMKTPVVLESSQNYEKTAIEYWFARCLDDGRDPTCPVTGQVLKSLEKKLNIGLAGAIEEWVNRNVDIQIKSALQHLSEDPPEFDCIEGVLHNILKVSEEHPSCRYKIRNAGVVVLIIKMLKNCSKTIGSHLRSKALMVFLSMSKDEESKIRMLEEGVTRLAIHGLTGSLEEEREYALKLLLEFSRDEAYCAKIASEKGALVLLSSMAGNLEHPSLSYLAEEVLNKVEKVDDNVQHLAAAGRFEPLLNRLCKVPGTDDIRIEMASMVGEMTLTNTSKEQIARQGAKILVDMLYKPQGRMASLQALYNLSTLDDNATILVDCGVLIPLTDILFKNQDGFQDLKELAVLIIANIVLKPGHWELEPVNKEGFSMQSEAIVHSIIGLLQDASSKGQVAILQILSGIASSPQASESVATHISSGGGITMVIPFLGHSEVGHRICALKLVRILSDKLGRTLVDELRASNNFPLLKDKLLDTQYTDEERSDAVCILANLPLTDDEVKRVLGASLIEWIVTTLKNDHRDSNSRTSRSTSFVVEGLLGLLLHFVKCHDQAIFDSVQEHRLMTLFREQLSFSLQPRVKQRAALGLKHLSESGRTLIESADLEPQPPHRSFSFLFLMCGKAPKVPPTCPIHSAPCEDDSQFCLVKSNCIKPLVDLLNDEDTTVQITAVEALSTLLDDSSHSLKRAVDELEQLGVVDAVIALFKEVRSGKLQERTIWMVERVLRVESHSHQYSIDQALVRALVEAFKHGNGNAKQHAQDSLTNLKQLSGVSGKNSTQAQRQTRRH